MKRTRESVGAGVSSAHDRERSREGSAPSVHGTAVVDARAQLGDGVVVGPYCVIGPEVVVGRDSVLMSHVVLSGPLVLGERCMMHPFSVVGGAPQVRADDEARARGAASGSVALGDDVTVREGVTVHRGTEGRITTVGSRVLLMAQAHVGHDARLGSSVVVANGVQLAGHAVIEDYVTFGGLAGVAQHVRIGESAFVAAGAMCEVDVPPFVIVQGDRARVRALNKIGLARRGTPAASIKALEHAFRHLYVKRGVTRLEALATIGVVTDPYVARLLAFVQDTRQIPAIQGK